MGLQRCRLMQRKRVLLFSLFFSILTGSLVGYALPRYLPHPSRRDTIPLGAFIVPWMQPTPSIAELNIHGQSPNSTPPFDINAVMINALKLNIIFTIKIPDVVVDTPEGKIHILGETRTVPSTVYLGHDSKYLYVGGRFEGMYTNPGSAPNDTVPNVFSVYFDVAGDGALQHPESGSNLAAFVSPTGPRGTSYDDMTWAYVHQYLGSDQWAWVLTWSYYNLELQKNQPVGAYGNAAMEYDIGSGTVTMLFSRLLRQPLNSEVNALQMRPGERWVMGFLLELGYNTNSQAGLFVDGWPQNIYPYLSDDSSWWPKLVIDLANPPANM